LTATRMNMYKLPFNNKIDSKRKRSFHGRIGALSYLYDLVETSSEEVVEILSEKETKVTLSSYL